MLSGCFSTGPLGKKKIQKKKSFSNLNEKKKSRRR